MTDLKATSNFLKRLNKSNKNELMIKAVDLDKTMLNNDDYDTNTANNSTTPTTNSNNTDNINNNTDLNVIMLPASSAPSSTSSSASSTSSYLVPMENGCQSGPSSITTTTTTTNLNDSHLTSLESTSQLMGCSVNSLNRSLSFRSNDSSSSLTKVNDKENITQQQQQFVQTKQQTQIRQQNKNEKYGELIVLGHNGYIKQNSKVNNCTSSRRKSKFSLKIREKPNGVKPYSQHNFQNNQEANNLVLKNENHSVTYTLSRHHTVVVQYTRDEKTDMFQIGRSTESAIDFIVLDTNMPTCEAIDQSLSENNKLNNRLASSNNKLAKSATSSVTTREQSVQQHTSVNTSENGSSVQATAQSTISRFACRIIVEREYPHTARIYAAGFDTSKRIFLGEKATKWKNEKGELDGVTTNGVLIMHPEDGFNCSIEPGNKQQQTSNYVTPEWMEVSVCGAVFSLNESRLTPSFQLNQPNSKTIATNKTNILRDGTLIDLCGATLLWRSVDSLKQTPGKHYLEMNLQNLNRLKPQCPVGFKTLVFPSSVSTSQFCNENINNNSNNSRLNSLMKAAASKNMERTPMVYLMCGHVHGHHNWGIKKDNQRECPLCRKVGPYVPLLIGQEPSFYCDKLTTKQTDDSKNHSVLFKPYAFLPCGHMASEATCKYWSKMLMPQGITQGLWSVCPFCAVQLCKEQPCVKLIFQEGL